jgi:hypothetical protein
VTEPLGTFGTLGRDALQGPGNWNFDTAIWRNFPIKESVTLTFRAEAFNAFNHLQIGNPSVAVDSALNFTSGTFSQTPSVSSGLISSAANNQRIMQLALKLTF